MHATKPGFAALSDHPAWQAAINAPLIPETDDEREAVAEALKSGPPVSGVKVTLEIAKRAGSC